MTIPTGAVLSWTANAETVKITDEKRYVDS
jgi:hypothetical protein